MDKDIVFSGYCPTQKKNYCVSVKYYDTSNYKKSEYICGLATCEYAKINHSHCEENCPIIKSTPERL